MLNIIHETKDIIIVNKPAGQLSQGAKGFDLDLVSEVMTYNASQGKPAYAAIINRLDRPVSGLVLIAKNKSAAAKYSTLMQKDGGFNKQYEALICGKLSEPKGTFVDYLKKDGRTNTSSIVPADAAANDKEAKLSKLEYEVISYDEVKDITHVRIHLITGRHHQIRVQFASRKMPLAGDTRYGARVEKCPVALLSRTLSFPLPRTGEPMSLDCPVPDAYPWSIFASLQTGGGKNAELPSDTVL